MSEHTVRYYVRIGLVRPRQDSLNGYYRYGVADLRALRFVRRAQSLGFTLSEIARILDIGRGNETTVQQSLLELVEHRLEQFTRDIGELLAARRRLRRLVRQWEPHPTQAPRGQDIDALIDAVAA